MNLFQKKVHQAYSFTVEKIENQKENEETISTNGMPFYGSYK
jgi:hypothetical protein